MENSRFYYLSDSTDTRQGLDLMEEEHATLPAREAVIIALSKAIVLSLISVFLLMPGVIMLFSKLMDTTKHKKFVPEIPFVGKYAYKTRYIIPPIFLLLIIAGRYYDGIVLVCGESVRQYDL